MVSSGTSYQIALRAVAQHIKDFRQRPKFVPGETKITYSTCVYDHQEALNLTDAALTQRTAAGVWVERYERLMREFFGCRDAMLVASGSSANLLMIATMCSPNVRGHLNEGDQVLTVGLGFPTTLSPVIQYHLEPVFVDVDDTFSPSVETIKAALGEYPCIKAILLPHPLGLPFDAAVVRDIANEYELWFLEDNCDSLGARVNGQLTGTFGDMSTLSHFPAHHTTAGQAGTVIVNRARCTQEVRSLAEWGRACWCLPGDSNTCGKRFCWDYPSMPANWDHKYTYTSLGFNLRPTEMQGAVMCGQYDKLEMIINKRRENFNWLCDFVKVEGLEEFFELPRVLNNCQPSPYAFSVVCREGVARDRVVEALEKSLIETRPFFAGNITRQPGFRNIKYKQFGDLANTDRLMERGFFIGCHPLLTSDELAYMADNLKYATVRSGPVRSGQVW